MHVGHYLGLVQSSEDHLARALTTVADHHGDEPDIYDTCLLLASWSRHHRAMLVPLITRYEDQTSDEPARLTRALFDAPRAGSLALVRDLHDLWLLASEVSLCWVILTQAGQALRDAEMLTAIEVMSAETTRQRTWLQSRIAQAAPQALVVAS